MFFYDHFQNELGTKTLDDFATAVLYYINKFQEFDYQGFLESKSITRLIGIVLPS